MYCICAALCVGFFSSMIYRIDEPKPIYFDKPTRREFHRLDARPATAIALRSVSVTDTADVYFYRVEQ